MGPEELREYVKAMLRLAELNPWRAYLERIEREEGKVKQKKWAAIEEKEKEARKAEAKSRREELALLEKQQPADPVPGQTDEQAPRSLSRP